MPKSHKPYPAELKARLVELVRAGRNPEELPTKFEPTAQAIRIQAKREDYDRRCPRRGRDVKSESSRAAPRDALWVPNGSKCRMLGPHFKEGLTWVSTFDPGTDAPRRRRMHDRGITPRPCTLHPSRDAGRAQRCEPLAGDEAGGAG